MKALLLTEYKRLEVTDVPEPEMGPDDVLIHVRACGICGSDIHGYDGSSGRRIPPLIMGHEASGVVAATGAHVRDLTEGERVTFDSMVSCGHCFFCSQGKTNLCDHRNVLGVSCGEYRRHGAFAEYVCVPRRIVHRLPDSLDFEAAAMIEAVSVAVHATQRTPLRLGDTAVVIGSGMIGLLVIQTLRLAGCSQIIAVDLNARRLELARELGADVSLKADETDVASSVSDLTKGRGADCAFEVVGTSPTVRTAIDATRKGGTVTLVGNVTPQVEFPLQSVVTREISVLGSCASSGEYAACIDMLNRRMINVHKLITATVSLDEGPAWFNRLYEGEPEAMKVLICPS